MALAVDSQMPSAVAVTISASTGPWTWSFTNTAGTVLYLFVVVASIGSSITITATYAGVSMTLLGSGFFTGNAQINLYRLTSPATGANNFVVTWDGTSRTLLASAISFTGNAATPDSGTASNANYGGGSSFATTWPLSITSTSSGNIVIQGVAYGDATHSTQTGTLSALKENDNSTTGNNHAMQYQNSVTGTTTPSITGTTSTSWFTVGIEVRTAAATTDQMMASINRPTNTPVFLAKGLLVYSFRDFCKSLERGFAWLTP